MTTEPLNWRVKSGHLVDGMVRWTVIIDGCSLTIEEEGDPVTGYDEITHYYDTPEDADRAGARVAASLEARSV
jgi:hypothetical protein